MEYYRELTRAAIKIEFGDYDRSTFKSHVEESSFHTVCCNGKCVILCHKEQNYHIGKHSNGCTYGYQSESLIEFVGQCELLELRDLLYGFRIVSKINQNRDNFQVIIDMIEKDLGKESDVVLKYSKLLKEHEVMKQIFDTLNEIFNKNE